MKKRLYSLTMLSVLLLTSCSKSLTWEKGIQYLEDYCVKQDYLKVEDYNYYTPGMHTSFASSYGDIGESYTEYEFSEEAIVRQSGLTIQLYKQVETSNSHSVYDVKDTYIHQAINNNYSYIEGNRDRSYWTKSDVWYLEDKNKGQGRYYREENPEYTSTEAVLNLSIRQYFMRPELMKTYSAIYGIDIIMLNLLNLNQPTSMLYCAKETMEGEYVSGERNIAYKFLKSNRAFNLVINYDFKNYEVYDEGNDFRTTTTARAQFKLDIVNNRIKYASYVESGTSYVVSPDYDSYDDHEQQINYFIKRICYGNNLSKIEKTYPDFENEEYFFMESF